MWLFGVVVFAVALGAGGWWFFRWWESRIALDRYLRGLRHTFRVKVRDTEPVVLGPAAHVCPPARLCVHSHGELAALADLVTPPAGIGVDVPADGGPPTMAIATRDTDGNTHITTHPTPTPPSLAQHPTPRPPSRPVAYEPTPLSRPVMFDGHPLIDPHAPVLLGGRQLLADRTVGGMRQVWDPDGKRWLCAVPIPGWVPPGPCGETVGLDKPCTSLHTARTAPPRPASSGRSFAADVVRRMLAPRGLDGR